MSDERIKILEERLMRLEAAMSQQPTARPGFTSPGGAVVDPAPHPGWGYPRPRPVVDPAPWPNPIVDPAVSIDRLRASAAATTLGRIGHIGDPPPIDISRLTASQLESSLHTINAERSRLDSMEMMIKQQLETMRRKDEG